MLNYNPSQLTDNVALLEEFHKIQSYLTEHPLYQQYGSQAIYQVGKTDYSLDTVIKPEGSKLGVGDVVIFSNVYYGIVTAVSETTFTVESAVNFRGTPGKDGYSTYLYDGALSTSVTSIDKSHIANPTGRFVQPRDIIISTLESTFGAMAQVVAVNDTIAAVDFIGTLQGGAGTSDYNMLDNIPVINQDLTASGFTPVANTYYRHTGATTATFTQGVIYLYDTAYHKLGESGGGTTLNKYTVSFNDLSYNNRVLMGEIIENAKQFTAIENDRFIVLSRGFFSNARVLSGVSAVGSSYNSAIALLLIDINDAGGVNLSEYIEIKLDGTITRNTYSFDKLITVNYWNDTEIT